MEAAAGGHLEVVTKLLELGVDPCVSDNVSTASSTFLFIFSYSFNVALLLLTYFRTGGQL